MKAQGVAARCNAKWLVRGLCCAAFSLVQRDERAAVALIEELLPRIRAAGDSRGAGRLALHAGILCQALGQLRRAAQHYEEVILAAPEHWGARVHASEVHHALGERQEAAARLAEGIALLAASGDDPELLEALRGKPGRYDS